MAERPEGTVGSTPARLVIATLVIGAIVLVALSLRRPELAEFPPSPILAATDEADSVRTGETRVLTVDATDPERWRYVSLARGTVVEAPAADGWDLAFRRFEARVNGGAGRSADAGVRELDVATLDSVRVLPATGYVGMTANGRDTTHALLDGWYTYSFTTHVLRPRPGAYAVRTTRGRQVALEFVSYYCPGAQPGCVTVRYRFVDPRPS